MPFREKKVWFLMHSWLIMQIIFVSATCFPLDRLFWCQNEKKTVFVKWTDTYDVLIIKLCQVIPFLISLLYTHLCLKLSLKYTIFLSTMERKINVNGLMTNLAQTHYRCYAIMTLLHVFNKVRSIEQPWRTVNHT